MLFLKTHASLQGLLSLNKKKCMISILLKVVSPFLYSIGAQTEEGTESEKEKKYKKVKA